MSQRAWRWPRPAAEEEEEEPCFLDMVARKPSPAEGQHNPASYSILRRKDQPVELASAETDSPPGTTQSKPSRFLRLPGELRLRIYEEVAVSMQLIHQESEGPFRRDISGPGLVLACTQTNREFKPVLFAMARWTIYVHEFDFRHVIAVEKRLSELVHNEPTCATAMLQLNPRLELVLINAEQWHERLSMYRILRWIAHTCSSDTPLSWVYRVEQGVRQQRLFSNKLYYMQWVGVDEIWTLREEERREEAIAVMEKLLWAFEDEAKRVEYALKLKESARLFQLDY